MRDLIHRKILCLLIALPLSVFDALEGKGEVRKIAFAKAYPTGTLGIMKKESAHGYDIPEVKALGLVSLNVPADCMVQLELNPHCIENPERLKLMPTDGIDKLRISYMSMDEDTLVVNQALAALSPFRKPIMLQCFRTDVTDAGISAFKSLSKLIRLDCFMCVIDGSFLKEAKQLQNLEELSLSHNALKMEYLKNLQDLKKLVDLDFSQTNLTDAGLNDVCKVKTLKFLTISQNSRLTSKGLQCLSQCTNLEELSIDHVKNCSDEIIPTLQKLIHLTSLDLSDTSVTERGIEKLRMLKLDHVKLPREFTPAEIEKLKKIFPKTEFLASKKVSEDIKIQFAPLK